MYIQTHVAHMLACMAKERKRKNVFRSANYPFFPLRLSLWSCAVCNIKSSPQTISQTVYLSFQIHKGGVGAVCDTGSFIH